MLYPCCTSRARSLHEPLTTCSAFHNHEVLHCQNNGLLIKLLSILSEPVILLPAHRYGRDLKFEGMASSSQAAPTAAPPVLEASGLEAMALLAQSKMRCGGCGGKVGASLLSRALARLPPPVAAPDVVLGLSSADDAAVVRPPPAGHLMVQTVDFFRCVGPCIRIEGFFPKLQCSMY